MSLYDDIIAAQRETNRLLRSVVDILERQAPTARVLRDPPRSWEEAVRRLRAEQAGRQQKGFWPKEG